MGRVFKVGLQSKWAHIQGGIYTRGGAIIIFGTGEIIQRRMLIKEIL